MNDLFWLGAALVIVGMIWSENAAKQRAHELEMAKIKCTTQQETQK